MPHPRSAPGFTLTELLVALTLLGVGLLALAGATVRAAWLDRWAAADSRVAAVAESRLEQWRAAPCEPAGASDLALAYDTIRTTADARRPARAHAFHGARWCP